MYTVRDGSDVGAPEHRGGHLSVQMETALTDVDSATARCDMEQRRPSSESRVANEVLGILG